MIPEPGDGYEIEGSTLAAHPKHVHAIGMISIENANLEHALSVLFSRVIWVPLRVGYAIYMTPKSAMAQLEILENAAEARLTTRKKGTDEHDAQMRDALKLTLKITAKARALIGKRHEVIHDSWGIDGDEVIRLKRGSTEEETPVPIQDLERLVSDYRRLIDQTMELAKRFRKRPPFMVDLRITK